MPDEHFAFIVVLALTIECPDQTKMTSPTGSIAAGLAAIILLGASTVSAQTPSDGVNLRFYGHFSPAGVGYDDGVDRYGSAADNASSVGRIGFWLETSLPRGQARFNLETSLAFRSSSSLSQNADPDLFDIDRATLRKLEIIYDTDRLGSFSFGEGSMASDGVTESDLSGTRLAAHVGLADATGGYVFRTDAGALSTISVASAFRTFDGGRAPRIRWDSDDLSFSKLGTFNIAIAAGVKSENGRVVLNDSLFDVGIFYRNRVDRIEVKASAAAAITDVNGARKVQTAASLSFLHAASGFSVTGAVGGREAGSKYIYLKLGTKKRWVPWGDTSLSIDLYRGEGIVSAGSTSVSYGLGIVQNLDPANLQIYLGLRRHELEQPGAVSYLPSSSIVFGTKWVFKRLEGLKLQRGRSEIDWNESG